MEYKIKDLNIHYEICGEGKPVICIHGYTIDHHLMKSCLEPVFQEEKIQYKRIYIDLPGMGQTKAVPWIKNADIMLEVLLEFINYITDGESFLLAAESYGCYLSMGILKKLQHQTDGVFFLCPCIISDYNERNLPSFTVVFSEKITDSGDFENEIKEFNEMAVISTDETWADYKTNILPSIKIADKDFLARYRENGYGFSFENDFESLTYNKPSAIITGRQDDSVGYKDMFKLLDNFPRAGFSILDGAGHNLQIEQPELFREYFRNWLKRTRY